MVSPGQTITLAAITIISASLSIVGSTQILLHIFTRNGKARRNDLQTRKVNENQNGKGTYERLIAMMSIFDIAFSLTLALQMFLTNRKEGYWKPLSIGNQHTCTAMGAMQQFSLSSFFYYGCLGFYFLLTLRFGMRQSTMARYIEPSMHALSILWPLTTSILGLYFGWYDSMELFPGCWSDGLPGGKSVSVNWTIAVGWQLFISVANIVNNSLVYFHVRKIYRSTFFRVHGSTSGTLQEQCPQDLQEQGIAFSNKNRHARKSTAENGRIQRMRFVATQCTFYVVAYFVTHTPFLVTRVIENNHNGYKYAEKYFPLLVLQAFCTPLAGFLNALIFFRPTYEKQKRERKNHMNLVTS